MVFKFIVGRSTPSTWFKSTLHIRLDADGARLFLRRQHLVPTLSRREFSAGTADHSSSGGAHQTVRPQSANSSSGGSAPSSSARGSGPSWSHHQHRTQHEDQRVHGREPPSGGSSSSSSSRSSSTTNDDRHDKKYERLPEDGFSFSERRTYYSILEVDNHLATEEEIKKAFKLAAKKWHPDRNPSPDAAQRFHEVQEAYATLSEKWKRDLYDTELRSRSVSERSGRGGNSFHSVAEENLRDQDKCVICGVGGRKLVDRRVHV